MNETERRGRGHHPRSWLAALVLGALSTGCAPHLAWGSYDPIEGGFAYADPSSPARVEADWTRTDTGRADTGLSEWTRVFPDR